MLNTITDAYEIGIRYTHKIQNYEQWCIDDALYLNSTDDTQQEMFEFSALYIINVYLIFAL